MSDEDEYLVVENKPLVGMYARRRPMIVTARQCTETTRIDTSVGIYFAGAGDWIIIEDGGAIYPVRAADFKENYDPLLGGAAGSQEEITRLRAENEELRARLVALEDEKNAYIDYVGNGLGQGDDESLWDAAQRVLSDRDRYRVIVDRLLEAADDNPFCTVGHFCEHGPVSSEIETARVRAMLELEEGE